MPFSYWGLAPIACTKALSPSFAESLKSLLFETTAALRWACLRLFRPCYGYSTMRSVGLVEALFEGVAWATYLTGFALI